MCSTLGCGGFELKSLALYSLILSSSKSSHASLRFKFPFFLLLNNSPDVQYDLDVNFNVPDGNTTVNGSRGEPRLTIEPTWSSVSSSRLLSLRQLYPEKSQTSYPLVGRGFGMYGKGATFGPLPVEGMLGCWLDGGFPGFDAGGFGFFFFGNGCPSGLLSTSRSLSLTSRWAFSSPTFLGELFSRLRLI